MGPSVLEESDVQSHQSAVDFLLYPSAVGEAPRLDAFTSKHSEYAQDVLNVPASLAGLPACSIPVRGNAWPLGLQIAGGWGRDKHVLDFIRTFLHDI